MSLQAKATSGILWSIGQQFGVRFIGVLVSIWLARLLSPAEFGLIAMLTIFIAIGTSLMDSGLTTSLIRTQDATQRDYSTVFFFNLAGGLLIYLILYVTAPFIADFYRQPLLTSIVRVYSITLVINAFYSIQNTLLTKEMKFKTQTAIQIPSIVIGGVVGLIMAIRGWGVWSIVGMQLTNTLVATILHWYFSPWRPALVFDVPRFKHHFHFGYKMTLSGMLETLYQNIYTIIIGKAFSATQLGFYARAESLSQLPVGIISSAINKATYPMFAMISDDNLKLKMVYKKLMQQVLFWNAPVLIFLAVIAHPLIELLLTAKWLPSANYFQILCIAGVLYPLHSYNLNILKVKGHSAQFLKLEVIKKVLGIVGILCVLPFGIYGLLYFQLFFTVLAYYINSIYSGKLINYPITEQIGDITPILFIAGMAGVICYLVDQWYMSHFSLSHILRICGLGVLYGILYLGISSLMKLSAITDFKQLILKI